MRRPDRIKKLVRVFGCKGFYDDGALIGIRHKGMIVWFQYERLFRGYVKTGSTLRPEGATYTRILI